MGRCNPCQALHCDSPSQCHLEPEEDLGEGEDEGFYEPLRTPKCVCDMECSENLAQICASDGKTVSASTFLS